MYCLTNLQQICILIFGSTDFCPPHFKSVETTYDNLFNTFIDFSSHFFKIGICRVWKSLHLKVSIVLLVSVLDNLCKFVCNSKLVNNFEEMGDILPKHPWNWSLLTSLESLPCLCYWHLLIEIIRLKIYLIKVIFILYTLCISRIW